MKLDPGLAGTVVCMHLQMMSLFFECVDQCLSYAVVKQKQSCLFIRHLCTKSCVKRFNVRNTAKPIYMQCIIISPFIYFISNFRNWLPSHKTFEVNGILYITVLICHNSCEVG